MPIDNRPWPSLLPAALAIGWISLAAPAFAANCEYPAGGGPRGCLVEPENNTHITPLPPAFHPAYRPPPNRVYQPPALPPPQPAPAQPAPALANPFPRETLHLQQVAERMRRILPASWGKWRPSAPASAAQLSQQLDQIAVSLNQFYLVTLNGLTAALYKRNVARDTVDNAPGQIADIQSEIERLHAEKQQLADATETARAADDGVNAQAAAVADLTRRADHDTADVKQSIVAWLNVATPPGTDPIDLDSLRTVDADLIPPPPVARAAATPQQMPMASAAMPFPAPPAGFNPLPASASIEQKFSYVDSAVDALEQRERERRSVESQAAALQPRADALSSRLDEITNVVSSTRWDVVAVQNDRDDAANKLTKDQQRLAEAAARFVVHATNGFIWHQARDHVLLPEIRGFLLENLGYFDRSTVTSMSNEQVRELFANGEKLLKTSVSRVKNMERFLLVQQQVVTLLTDATRFAEQAPTIIAKGSPAETEAFVNDVLGGRDKCSAAIKAAAEKSYYVPPGILAVARKIGLVQAEENNTADPKD